MLQNNNPIKNSMKQRLLFYLNKIYSVFSPLGVLCKNYFIIIALPGGYKPKNIKILLIIFLLIISSMLFTTQIYLCLNKFIWFNNISGLVTELLSMFSYLYILFIIFNIIIRTYNIFIRSIIYFIKDINISSTIKSYYYIYNIIMLIISVLLIHRIYYSIDNYNSNYTEYIYSFSFLISFIGALIYIDYSYNNNDFKVMNNIKLTNFHYIIQFITIFIISFYILNNIIIYFENSYNAYLELNRKNLILNKSCWMVDPDNKGKLIKYNDLRNNNISQSSSNLPVVTPNNIIENNSIDNKIVILKIRELKLSELIKQRYSIPKLISNPLTLSTSTVNINQESVIIANSNITNNNTITSQNLLKSMTFKNPVNNQLFQEILSQNNFRITNLRGLILHLDELSKEELNNYFNIECNSLNIINHYNNLNINEVEVKYKDKILSSSLNDIKYIFDFNKNLYYKLGYLNFQYFNVLLNINDNIECKYIEKLLELLSYNYDKINYICNINFKNIDYLQSGIVIKKQNLIPSDEAYKSYELDIQNLNNVKKVVRSHALANEMFLGQCQPFFKDIILKYTNHLPIFTFGIYESENNYILNNVLLTPNRINQSFFTSKFLYYTSNNYDLDLLYPSKFTYKQLLNNSKASLRFIKYKNTSPLPTYNEESSSAALTRNLELPRNRSSLLLQSEGYEENNTKSLLLDEDSDSGFNF